MKFGHALGVGHRVEGYRQRILRRGRGAGQYQPGGYQYANKSYGPKPGPPLFGAERRGPFKPLLFGPVDNKHACQDNGHSRRVPPVEHLAVEGPQAQRHDGDEVSA